MLIKLEILRRKSPADQPYTAEAELETEDNENITVAEALERLNNGQLSDDPVMWECSCKQKKCGACAMLINGRPRLACDAWLKEFTDGRVRLEPLSKFPVIRDLAVDRSVMFDNLRKIGAWLGDEAVPDMTGGGAYDASRCLQCGCCLEVCPNFYAGGEFFGAAALAPASRLIAEVPASQKKRIFGSYSEHFYRGCGKSLACRDICPAGIDTESLLVNSNAAAVWKRKFRGRKK